MTMKRRNQTICAVLLSTLLIGIPVQAEIPEDALSDYMGDWYVNYMVEEGTQLNMAGLLGYTMLLTLNDDGTAHMEMMMLEESAEDVYKRQSVDTASAVQPLQMVTSSG